MEVLLRVVIRLNRDNTLCYTQTSVLVGLSFTDIVLLRISDKYSFSIQHQNLFAITSVEPVTHMQILLRL